MRYTLKKHQILRSKKDIKCLFQKGSSIPEYPLKLIYLIQPLKPAETKKYDRFQVMIIVPKKYIKKAAHRNLVKRQIKEHFRLQQHQLSIPPHHLLKMAFIYLSKDKDPSTLSKIPSSLQKIISKLNTRGFDPKQKSS